MPLKFPEFPTGVWVRTCQECGHRQVMKSPLTQKTENWREAKCRKCKSEALDYGMENYEEAEWEEE